MTQPTHDLDLVIFGATSFVGQILTRYLSEYLSGSGETLRWAIAGRSEAKLRDVIDGIEQIATMDDPVGRVLEKTELDQGLILHKVQTPIGVLAIIYESRPDAGPQIAALAIRTGNAVLLKGGREAANTNAVLGDLFRAVLKKHGVEDAVQLVSTREEITDLLKMDTLIDLVIPRGSNEMVRTIQQSTKIPVLGHADGVCHVYIDEFADVDKAVRIAVDSKAQYPAVCNAAETLLVHSKFSGREQVLDALRKAGVELRDSGFGSEYLDLVMNVKTVNSLDEAVAHIHRYGSRHTDSIVTENETNAERRKRIENGAHPIASRSPCSGFPVGSARVARMAKATVGAEQGRIT